MRSDFGTNVRELLVTLLSRHHALQWSVSSGAKSKESGSASRILSSCTN
jgi:hypothetical protein